jgi:hypothetical protein
VVNRGNKVKKQFGRSYLKWKRTEKTSINRKLSTKAESDEVDE